MARLTKAIKDQIVHNALCKAGVFQRELDLKLRNAELAEKVRIYAMGGEENEKSIIKNELKINKLINDLPDNLHTTGNFRIGKQAGIKASFGGMQTILYYSGGDGSGNDERVYKKPSPYMFGCAVKFDVDSDLSKEFHSIEKETKIVSDLKQSVSLNVRAMVDSVTTDKKLIEVWSESKELIPTDINKPKVNLPTTDVMSLNAMIGIPSEKEDA